VSGIILMREREYWERVGLVLLRVLIGGWIGIGYGIRKVAVSNEIDISGSSAFAFVDR